MGEEPIEEVSRRQLKWKTEPFFTIDAGLIRKPLVDFEERIFQVFILSNFNFAVHKYLIINNLLPSFMPLLVHS